MTTVGRWNPNKVRERVLNGTWVSAEELGGMVLLTPTSIAYTGTSASIGANGSVEFSAITALTLNGVFTADYDNYMIAWRGDNSVSAGWRAQFTLAATPSTTGYTRQYISANGTSVTAARATSTSMESIVASAATQRAGFTVYLFGPSLAQPTAVRSVSVRDDSSARIFDSAFTHSVSTAYDGIYFFPSSGDSTGLVSVYGLVGA